MKTYNNLNQVAEDLNEKYSKIKDFDVFVMNDVVRGGFYKMQFLNTNTYSDDEMTYNEFFDLLDKRVQEKLTWQKESDEAYARDYNKKVVYKFDYSLIEK